MWQTGRKALGVAAAGVVAAAGLVMTAATGAAGSSGTELAHAGSGVPTQVSTDPASLVIPENERNNLLALIADGAPLTARATAWTQTGTGALINQNGSMLLVAAVTNSLDGDGAAVAKVTLNGNDGTDTAVRYTANGVMRGEETFTNGAPDANGVIPLTGEGKCAGGTGVHKREKCSYTFTGTYDPNTSAVSFTITGTTTR